MSEFVEFSSRRREEEIKRILAQASPVVIWPAEEGIVIIAANRDQKENRVHSIYDRIACVTLGAFSGGTILWQDAALRASKDGSELSRGDVPCRVLIRQTAALLSESFNNLRRGPLFGVEAIFVEIGQARDNDYLVHLSFMGFVNTFSEAKLFGQLNPDSGGENNGDEATKRAEKKLSEIWNPTLSVAEAVEMMKREYLLKNIFWGTRVEIVVMDRSAVLQGRFNQVFKRTA